MNSPQEIHIAQKGTLKVDTFILQKGHTKQTANVKFSVC